MKLSGRNITGPMALAVISILIVGMVGAYVIVSSVVQFTSVSVQSSETQITLGQMNQAQWDYYGAAPLSMLPAGNAQTLSNYGVGFTLQSQGYFSNVGLKMDLTYSGPAADPGQAVTLQYKVGAEGTWTTFTLTWDGTTGTYNIPIAASMQPQGEAYCLVKITYNAPGTWGYSFTAIADAQ